MIFVDTNFINRHLLQDIPEQSQLASSLITDSLEKKVVLVSTDLVFFEVVWSLKQFYEWSEQNILEAMFYLISPGAINFQNNDVLIEAILECQKNNLGIEDNYNLCWSRKYKATKIASFDKKTIK
jgi:predicted nucleic-acid-binding protein